MSLLTNPTMMTRDHHLLRRPASQSTSSALLEMPKEEEEVIIPCLQHEDMVTQILNRVVPPQSLYVNLRYVCKPWFNIITSTVFQNNHPVSIEPPCLIIQNRNYTSSSFMKSRPEDQANMLIEQAKTLGYVHNPRYVQVGFGERNIQLDLVPAFRTLRTIEGYTTCSIQVGGEGIIQQADVTSDFNKLRIKACCNGLMIVCPDGSPTDTLYLVNLITKQSVKLPPPYIVDLLMHACPTVGFTFIPSTAEYKVVLLRDALEEGASKKNALEERALKKRKKRRRDFNIQVLTSGGCGGGSSSYEDLYWRVVQAPKLDKIIAPISVDGVLYWGRSYHTRIVTCFDAREERFYTVSCPGNDPSVPLHKEGLLEMAGYLASWIYLQNHQQLDFWVLKNFRTGGEWVKHSSMRIGDQGIARRIDETSLMPTLSYGSDGEVIIFLNHLEGNLLAYNMRSSIWWKMGNKNPKLVGDSVWFHGFHVNKILPLDSLLKKKPQPV